MSSPDAVSLDLHFSRMSLPASADYDAVVLAVAHRAYRELGGAGVRALVREGGLVYDIKSALPRGSADARL